MPQAADGKKFPYTKEGMRQAKEYERKTGIPIQETREGGGPRRSAPRTRPRPRNVNWNQSPVRSRGMGPRGMGPRGMSSRRMSPGGMDRYGGGAPMRDNRMNWMPRRGASNMSGPMTGMRGGSRTMRNPGLAPGPRRGAPRGSASPFNRKRRY